MALMKSINQRVFSSLIIVILISFAVSISAFLVVKKQRNNKTVGDYFSVKVIDASSQKPIVNTTVDIVSDNGIRCIKAPCPTDTKKWSGKTNMDGVISVPSKILNTVTNISVNGYRSRYLSNSTEKTGNNYSLILDPNSKNQ